MEDFELAAFKTEWATVNPKDALRVRKWFLDYPELTLLEHARIMNKAWPELHYLRQYCGVNPLLVVETPQGRLTWQASPRKKQKLERLGRPVVRETILQLYEEGKSIREVSRITGNARRTIQRIVGATREIRPFSQVCASQNPCNSREWLLEHYVRKRLSTRQCGALAGVSHVSIRQWIRKHGLASRCGQDNSRDAAILDQAIADSTAGERPMSLHHPQA
jgi:transposase-like protein